MRLLAIHDCHFVETQAKDPHLVLAKVAGYDTAVYGLEDTKAFPAALRTSERRCAGFDHQAQPVRHGPLRAQGRAADRLEEACSTGSSRSSEPPMLEWTPTVRPTYSRDAELPAGRGPTGDHPRNRLAHQRRDAGQQSIEGEVRRAAQDREWCNAATPSARSVRNWPAGDGEHGVLEGFNSTIRHDGTQPVRWWLRSDSNGESALAFALRSKIDGDERSARVAANLLDWVYFNSGLFQKDPAKGRISAWFTGHPTTTRSTATTISRSFSVAWARRRC